MVDACGADQRFALGGDRGGHRGASDEAPGVFGPQLHQRAVRVGYKKADAGGFAVGKAHLIQRALGVGEIETYDPGTEMVDDLRNLTLAGRRHGNVVGTQFYIVAWVGLRLQNRVTEDPCVEMDGLLRVIDGDSQVIERTESEGRARGESSARGKRSGRACKAARAIVDPKDAPYT